MLCIFDNDCSWLSTEFITGKLIFMVICNIKLLLVDCTVSSSYLLRVKLRMDGLVMLLLLLLVEIGNILLYLENVK